MTLVAAHQTHALFVAWQQPHSRQFFPVGRLVSGINHGRPRYEFSYVQSAEKAKAEGFEPFLAFPQFDVTYRSDELFPMFANRVMSSKRPDYPQYLGSIGLPPDASPTAVLARTGGRRVTDSLELFEFPRYDPARNVYTTFFLAHGIRHLPEASVSRVNRLVVGEKLYLGYDFQNPVDPQAMFLRTEDMHIVGFVPRYLLEDAWQLIQKCIRRDVFVAQVNQPPAGLEERLLSRFESCWPSDFKPYCQEPYRPIPKDAEALDCGR